MTSEPQDTAQDDTPSELERLKTEAFTAVEKYLDAVIASGKTIYEVATELQAELAPQMAKYAGRNPSE